MARTYSYRGGTGYDITVLRPKESKVNNAAITSSGSVSFLPSFSMVTKTIGQHGRRGASLGSIDIRHPDSLDFI
jgi:ribonucleoside-diphosphate reductase alpha chain